MNLFFVHKNEYRVNKSIFILSFREHYLKNKAALKSIAAQSKYVHVNTQYNMLKLLYKIILIFPFTTTLCESGFSHMNQIKSPFRNKLEPSTVADLMFLALYPSFPMNYRKIAIRLASSFRFF